MSLATTGRLDLREFTAADFEDVQRYAADPEVTRFMSWGPNDETETRAFLERAVADAAVQPRADYNIALVRRSDGRVIGAGGLHVRRAPNREFETGYCISRDCWGLGFAGEALAALLELGFLRAGAHRIYALVDPENAASVRVVERAGLRREGHLRRDSLVRGEWRDSLVFALLEEEWRPGAGVVAAREGVPAAAAGGRGAPWQRLEDRRADCP
jgi:RimJ/RimL family protein N-acetyltransferase